MKTMAAILVEQKKPLVIDEVELPSLEYGQVLVEQKTSRICGSQIGEVDGVKGPDPFLPHLLGHEGAGIVSDVGPEVTQVKKGDHVVLHWRPGAGIQARSPIYSWNGKKLNAGSITTFQKNTIVSENRVTPIPKTLDWDIAPLLADTLITGFGIINNDAAVKIGESVVIIGCGGIGLGVLLGAKLAGAYPIIAVDIHDHKLSKAKEYGATYTINSRTVDFVKEVRSLVGEKGADVIIDGTGSSKVIEQAYALTHSKGRCVLFGVMPHDQKVSIHTLPLHHGKILTGSEGGGSMPHLDIPRYVRMIEQGIIDPKGFISHRTKLEQVNETMLKMKAGEVIHAIMDFE